MKKHFHLLLTIFITVTIVSCNGGKAPTVQPADDNSPHVVKKRRDDGTLSSLNPVDSAGYLNGVQVNFYEDGLTVHSKVTYEHGRKQGAAIWFFKSGKIYENTTYEDNKKEGVSRRYYETGELYEELPFEAGEELPGRKRYDKEGNLISH
jgi:antitoxin component YwqK of YwqJK toxin-antitoxin module